MGASVSGSNVRFWSLLLVTGGGLAGHCNGGFRQQGETRRVGLAFDVQDAGGTTRVDPFWGTLNLSRSAYLDGLTQTKLRILLELGSSRSTRSRVSYRRIGAVIRRAWELGARNDGWWLEYESCYKKWGQAIKDAGMDWKYRQARAAELLACFLLRNSLFAVSGSRISFLSKRPRSDRGLTVAVMCASSAGRHTLKVLCLEAVANSVVE